MAAVTERAAGSSAASAALLRYIFGVAALAVALAALGWWIAPSAPDLTALVLLSALGVLSWNLREPDVGSRVSISFLSIVLLASAVIVGPFGAAIVGVISVAIDARPQLWFQRLFNMAMCGIIGAAGGLAYLAAGGATDLASVSGVVVLTMQVGFPLAVADLVECITNAALLSGVMRLHRGIPFGVTFRGVILGSGVAYVGYGVIGFLFVVLWYPADIGPFSAALILAPLLAARWAFIQYGDELRAHERTVDTLVTALGTKLPVAVGRSRRMARLAEWIAEEMGLGMHQIGAARYAATLHEIGQLAVPTRLLRRDPATLSADERRVLNSHPAIGAQMIAGIDFLEDVRSGIRHQHARFDGSGEDPLLGAEIPLASRIVAVAARFEQLTGPGPAGGLAVTLALDVIRHESGTRFDPAVVDALDVAMDKQAWPPPVPVEVTR